MKIKISKKQIEAALKLCERYTDKYDASSISSHFLFVAKNDTLDIISTDYEFGLIYTIPNVNVLASGLTTASAKQVLNIISKLDKDKDIIIQALGTDTVISQDAFNFKLDRFNEEDFPVFCLDDKSLTPLNIDSNEFLNRLKLIEHAIDKNNPQHTLNGAFVEIKAGKMNFVGTDTKRLALSNLEYESNLQTSFIIPKRVIAEMQRLFKGNVELMLAKKDIGGGFEKGYFVAKGDGFMFHTQLLDGNFPNHERLFPESTESFDFNVKSFSNYLKKLAIVGDKFALGLRADSKLVLASLNADNPRNFQASAIIDSKFIIQKEHSIFARIAFFADFLNQVEENTFKVHFSKKKGESVIMLSSDKLTELVIPLLDDAIHYFREAFGFDMSVYEQEKDEVA